MLKPNEKPKYDPATLIVWGSILLYFAICFIYGGIKLTTIIFHFLKDLIL